MRWTNSARILRWTTSFRVQSLISWSCVIRILTVIPILGRWHLLLGLGTQLGILMLDRKVLGKLEVQELVLKVASLQEGEGQRVA